MNQSTRGSTKRNLQCKICHINFSTQADYALHEFSKRHCHNLLKSSKNKPIIPKKKPVQNSDFKPIINETQKSEVAQKSSIAKYGYFVPGELYVSNPQATFDTEHDPYAERCNVNCWREALLTVSYQSTDSHTYKPQAQVSCPKRKKKKKAKSCPICQVKCTTALDYNTHLKSPQHMWRLKTSGRGVSAHFVKASTDLHTTEVSARAKPEPKEAQLPSTTTQQMQSEYEHSSPPTLSFNISKISFSTTKELNKHAGDKCHVNGNQVADTKVKTEKSKPPSSSHLYCYSCKISLNNILQYNDHKNGKKHKMKCKQLMRKGITIPPEETLSDWHLPPVHQKKTVIFPNFYESFLERKKASDQPQVEDNEDTNNSCAINNDSWKTRNEYLKEGNFPHRMGNLVVLTDEEALTCQICDENFIFQSLFDSHLASESHLLKVWKKKESGVSDCQILNMIFMDRNKIRPDENGRWNCFLCDVISNTVEEFMHHINTSAHKNIEIEYIQKKTVEVLCIRGPDEHGYYSCEQCKERFKSLVDFCRHLPSDHLDRANSSQV